MPKKYLDYALRLCDEIHQSNFYIDVDTTNRNIEKEVQKKYIV